MFPRGHAERSAAKIHPARIETMGAMGKHSKHTPRRRHATRPTCKSHWCVPRRWCWEVPAGNQAPASSAHSAGLPTHTQGGGVVSICWGLCAPRRPLLSAGLRIGPAREGLKHLPAGLGATGWQKTLPRPPQGSNGTVGDCYHPELAGLTLTCCTFCPAFCPSLRRSWLSCGPRLQK